MANPRFTWNPEGYIQLMHSDGVVNYLKQKASEITNDANSSSVYRRDNRTNYAYKILGGGRKPVAVIHTASWPGMYDQYKYGTLKKALLKHKQISHTGGGTDG